MTPRVSVLIVNYNAGPHLLRCIAALRRQTVTDFEAIVVDNASTDGSFALARKSATGDPRFHWDDAGQNLGFAAGSNRAARRARADWLATLNPDAFAAPDWLARLLDATARYPDVDMFGSTQFDARRPGMLDGGGDAYLAAGVNWRGGYGRPAAERLPTCEVFAPCAAAALYRSSAFRAAGGFDESFFCYCEDIDLGFRLRLMGARCVQLEDATVEHIGGGAGSSDAGFARYHGVRNMIWTFVKNMPGPLIWLTAPAHIAALAVHVSRAAVRGNFNPVRRGIQDAILGLPKALSSRARIQRTRRATTFESARALCWSPALYLRRGIHRLGPAERQAAR